MKTININFVDFWPGFDKNNNYFYQLLKEEFNIVISNNPDYLFYSGFGNQHKMFDCVKIYYTGENRVPPSDCDWSFSFENTNDKNYRLPLYLLYDGYYELLDKKVDEDLLNRKFCNQVISNGNGHVRNDIYRKLSQYKHIDSGGRFGNNIGGPVVDKLEFISDYKFSLSYENEDFNYPSRGCSITSEKVMEPMKVNSITIYWGNKRVSEEFNSDSFINRYDFDSDESMIEYIIKLDTDDELYMEKLNKPWFINNEIPEELKLVNIKKFLYNIFSKFEMYIDGKVGRNEPCPCGSGKKLKKCHG